MGRHLCLSPGCGPVKEEKVMKKVFVVLGLVLVVSLSLSADVNIKMKNHTDAMSIMGQTTPAQDSVSDQWIAADKFAIVSADQSFIVDTAKNMVYFVYPKTKTYVETPMPLDIAKILPPQAAAMAGMMTMTATVVPTTEKKKIGQWNCTGYDVTVSIMGMPMKERVWATMETGFDVAAFNAKFLGPMLKGTMRFDDASVKEMQKIQGFQVATEMNGEMMGAKVHSTMDVLEISKKSPPANPYVVPAGYTKQATIELPKR
jgi:hypothetical protein